MDEQNGAPVLDGLDGKLFVTDTGVRFERSKLSARGRGVAQVIETPWSTISSAEVVKNALRITVAEYQPPKGPTSDPWAVAIRRGRHPEAEAIAELIRSRCAGAAAAPLIARAEPSPVVPADVRVPQDPTTDQQRREAEAEANWVRAVNAQNRVLKWENRVLGCQIVALLIPAVIFAIVAVVVVVLVLRG